MTQLDADTTKQPLAQRMRQIHQSLTGLERVLAQRTPQVSELHTVVEGTMNATTALAELVATVIRQAPATLANHSQDLLGELLADLRALHGCLTTGPPLLAPARDDLHTLLTQNGTPRPVVRDKGAILEATAHDVAEQHQPVRLESTSDEPDLAGIGTVMEADPADVLDQRRTAPVLNEVDPAS